MALRLKSIPFFLFFFFLLPLAHAEVSVTAQVDRTHASLDDEIELVVTVSGTSRVSDPELPPMPAFNVAPMGSSSSIQIINTHMEIQKQFSFVLIPKEAGTFTINPVRVVVDGQNYQSQSLQITVTPSGGAPQRPQSLPQTPGQFPVPPDQVPSQEEGRPYWISAEVSNKNPYVNEQILFTFRFYTAVNVGSATLDLPEFKEFWTEEVVPEKRYYQTINGRRYVVSEKVVALFPLQSGPATLDQVSLKVEVPDERQRSLFQDPFFGLNIPAMQWKTLRAGAISLNVKPLPQAPDDFSNLVGQFSLKTDLSPQRVKQGDSVTLKIEISGTGNIKDGVLPKNLGLESFKVYDDKPSTTTTKTERGLEGKKVFKKALVPTKAGEIQIPSFSVSYFDPKKESFERMESEPVTLFVDPSQQESLQTAQAQPPSAQKAGGAEDISTIHTHVDLQKNTAPLSRTLVLLGLFLPPFFFMVLFLITRGRKSLEDKAPLYKSKGAYKVFHHKLLRVPAEGGEEASQILEHVREYVGNRCHVFGKALTSLEMTKILESKGVGRDLTGRLQNLIAALEAESYAGFKSTQSMTRAEIDALIQQIDKKVRG